MKSLLRQRVKLQNMYMEETCMNPYLRWHPHFQPTVMVLTSLACWHTGGTQYMNPKEQCKLKSRQENPYKYKLQNDMEPNITLREDY